MTFDTSFERSHAPNTMTTETDQPPVRIWARKDCPTSGTWINREIPQSEQTEYVRADLLATKAADGKDSKAIHDLFSEFHYADNLGVIKTKVAEYVATRVEEAVAGFALCKQVQKRAEHSSSMCACVTAMEESIRKEAREEAFRTAKTVSVGLEHKEASRIANQIIADVCAQLGVRGSAEERDGAAAVVSSWLITLHRRLGERYGEALEAASRGEE